MGTRLWANPDSATASKTSGLGSKRNTVVPNLYASSNALTTRSWSAFRATTHAFVGPGYSMNSVSSSLFTNPVKS